MAYTLQQLKDEVVLDPIALGYAPLRQANALGAIGELINAVSTAFTIPRTNVTPVEVLEAIDLLDMATNSTNVGAPVQASEVWRGSWFESVMQSPTMQLRKYNVSGSTLVDTRVLSNIKLLLVNGSGSESRLRTVGQRSGSRAEKLWGEGTVVSVLDIQNALQLP